MATTAGLVDIVPMAGADLIAGLTMDQGLDNFRPPEKQKEVLVHISGRPGRMVSLAVDGQNIIGYIALHQVNQDYPALHELQGIEVAPSRRKFGVAARLLSDTFAVPVFEDYIVFVTGDPDYWDMARTGLNVWQYRRALTRLYESVGFTAKSVRTPDILCNVADLFMIRAGRNVPAGWETWCYPLLGVDEDMQ